MVGDGCVIVGVLMVATPRLRIRHNGLPYPDPQQIPVATVESENRNIEGHFVRVFKPAWKVVWLLGIFPAIVWGVWHVWSTATFDVSTHAEY